MCFITNTADNILQYYNTLYTECALLSGEAQWARFSYDEKMAMLTKHDRLDLAYAVHEDEEVVKDCK